LVTGGAGFIGATLVGRLLAAGHDVSVIDDGDGLRHRRARAELPQARWISVDMARIDLADLLAGFDGVVHLAGQPGVQTSWGTGFDEHLRANTLLTQRLLEAAIGLESCRMVLASSSSVYGEIITGTACEDTPLRPLSPYGVSKVACEQLMRVYVERGVDAVALRFFTAYGRRQRQDMALSLIIDAALGGPAFPMRGDGSQARDFTHVDDIAAAIEAALFGSIPAGTVCNVGTGSPVSLVALIDLVETITGMAVALNQVPSAAGDPVRTAADVSRAKTLLAWKPTVGLAEGVEDQIEYQVAVPSSVEQRSQTLPVGARCGDYGLHQVGGPA